MQGWNAEDAVRRGEEAAGDHKLKIQQAKADQTAVMAANGLDISQGTPVSILDDTQYMGDVDIARIRTNAGREAWGSRVGQRNSMATASMLDAQGSAIKPGQSALMAAGSSLASNWSAFKTS